MYLLAALEPGRASLQILHENDNCCFRGAGIHAEIMRYDAAISAALSLAAAGQAPSHGHGVFSTAVVDWPIHMVSARGKDVIEAALSRSIVAATTGALVNLTGLPCDMLRGGGVACHEGPVPPHYIPPPRPRVPPPPPNKMACEHKISEGDCLAGCCSWDSAKHRCDEASPFNRVHRGGCYEGAKPPCVYVQATCEKTPSSSQRWRFVPILLPPPESEQWQHSLVQIVHMTDGMCLSQACASGHNCSRILQHNQFDLAQCDAAESRQRFLLQNSSDSGAVILTSSIDEAFRVNVGEVSALQKPLQLWRPCTKGDEPYEKGIGFSNEIFRLDSEGGLRVKFGMQSFVDCVDVCHAGSMACGDKPPVKTDDGGGDLQVRLLHQCVQCHAHCIIATTCLHSHVRVRACACSQRGIQFLGKGMEGAFAYDDPRALQSLKNLASTGADHIALTFSWYLNGTTSRTNHTSDSDRYDHSSDTDEGWRFSTGPIRPIDGPAPSGLNFANCSTPTDHELITVITEAHALNLSVKLRPVVQADFPFTNIPGCTLATGGMGCPSQTGVGAGMSAAEFQVFFWGSNGTVTHPSEGSYAYFIYHIATLAERTKTEIVSVSVEMSSANSQEAHFRKLIGGVRKIYSGKLHCDVASAPLSSTRAITDVKFWDLLDAVGVDAYPALTDGIPANETNPTVEQLVAAFGPVLKLMSDFYHGRVPPPPLPPGPQAPPCAVGENLTNYSNFYPHHLAGPSGPNTAYVQYLGKASSIDDCLALCQRRSNCTSWSWHPKDSSTSSQHCFARSDGKWTPTYSPGDVCGKVKDSCVPHCPPEPTGPNWYPAQNNTPIIWAENGLISTFNSFRHPGELRYDPCLLQNIAAATARMTMLGLHVTFLPQAVHMTRFIRTQCAPSARRVTTRHFSKPFGATLRQESGSVAYVSLLSCIHRAPLVLSVYRCMHNAIMSLSFIAQIGGNGPQILLLGLMMAHQATTRRQGTTLTSSRSTSPRKGSLPNSTVVAARKRYCSCW